MALVITGAISTAANAQETATAPAAKPQLSKEEKAKQKEKMEAGLTDQQIKEVKEVNADASTKGNAVKKDATLTDEAKKTKLKEISEEKNNKLKEIMGKEKYKLYSEARKKQKEAAPAPAMQ